MPGQHKAQEFLKVASQFQLGALPTEQRHPLTYELAALSRNDIPAALAILKDIDMGVLRQIATYMPALEKLQQAIRDTLKSGNRVFFYGCGATGRLSISLEHIWRYMNQNDHVTGFMSGGDLALVHSIENFEDHPDYGARQVREIGFGANDLLVSCTEGGETPSVIGATEEAARISSRKPFFLYCNPEHVLHEQVERSRAVIENPAIEKICLYVGPMALSGSTRMQASTALMLGAGLALFHMTPHQLEEFIAFVDKTDFGFLKGFIEEESSRYAEGDFILYETDAYAITILTDTTERAPTFSLRGFENQNDKARTPALSYLCLPEAEDAAAAWRKILRRAPLPLEWDNLRAIAGHERLLGFDFSVGAREQRQELIAPRRLHCFTLDRLEERMAFALGPQRHTISVRGLHPLFEHILLKLLLNTHSTLVMGRHGRFESNVMTWVKPSNNKLIDRAIRYVEYLLLHENILGFSYQDICEQLFAEMEQMAPSESVVLRTVESLRQRKVQ